ncbi:polyprenyl synthetase [Candidatus Methylomirabilis lanthanidiphila]|uniref:Polyprenyl synthetase n=1 Tax=Candidatus Methylomirabilis lanthanidiphila TaxID=2211376 RepID=A0A564ZG38_9BACT|nr:polyprenyl synthetase family protein [Candidatus Methylomirabilis lanthanidiphila]VUZ84133.1 polyprenyl synthetase [Candidatus Methylomirabilis lanthanidiphila]
MIAETILSPVAPELALVEERLLQDISGDVELISEIIRYVLKSGGKRVRPALLLLSAKLCGYGGGARNIDLAVVAEYMHAATLIHDDIIDRADKRRGLPSANSTWGSQISVLAGDFLYARSLQMLVIDGDLAVMRAFADATVRMIEGQVREAQMAGNLDLAYHEYLNIITSKTAALISVACRTGALIAGRPAEEVAALTEFGLNLGIGFQLVDDALDFVAEEDRLGKPVGNDFKEGKVTFPVLHVMRAGSEADQGRIRELAAQTTLGESDLAEVKAIVERYGAVSATMELVRTYLKKAKTSLGFFPDSAAKRSLVLMVDFVGDRDW